MSEILVSIIIENKAPLYRVEANLKAGRNENITLCNCISGQGSGDIDYTIVKVVKNRLCRDGKKQLVWNKEK